MTSDDVLTILNSQQEKPPIKAEIKHEDELRLVPPSIDTASLEKRIKRLDELASTDALQQLREREQPSGEMNFKLEDRGGIWCVVGKNWVRPANDTEKQLWDRLQQLREQIEQLPRYVNASTLEIHFDEDGEYLLVDDVLKLLNRQQEKL